MAFEMMMERTNAAAFLRLSNASMGFGAANHRVIFNRPTADVFDGQLRADDYEVKFLVAEFPGVVEGSALTIAGEAFVVRDIDPLADGGVIAARVRRA
jgi:hypothetical protein